jgi:hypothetical protein
MKRKALPSRRPAPFVDHGGERYGWQVKGQKRIIGYGVVTLRGCCVPPASATE